MTDSFGPEQFRRSANVSRETLTALSTHVELLRQWQAKINLVGPATLADVWRRHVWDSAQLFPWLPPDARTIVDIGSGGGFPGLVLAAMLAEAGTDARVHLIESTGRKADFLRAAVRSMGLAVSVHQARAESMTPFPADAVTARACARLTRLLELAAPFAHRGTVLLFPKGKDHRSELTEARKWWTVECDLIRSVTDENARILRVSKFRRRPRR